MKKTVVTLMLCLLWTMSTIVNAQEIPNNQIWYEANNRISEAGPNYKGLHIDAFNATITSHEFSNGKGIITFNADVTRIGNSAFFCCSGLNSIAIPNSVTSVGQQAFQGCSSLTSIAIPNSVTSIGSSAFNNCPSLTSIIVESGNTKYDSRNNCNAIIETATNTLIVGCKNTTVPSSVTSIGDDAFYCCSDLTSIAIPNSVTSIGGSAFYGCSSLTSIEIPSSVTSIEDCTFSSCSSLTSIAIPNSVTSIGSSAFSYCSGLTSITIPNSVTSIGDWTFSGCSDLTSITIPNSVTSIGKCAFSGCSNLTSITIPNSVTSIGECAFSGCRLNSLTIGSGVLTIGHQGYEPPPTITKTIWLTNTPPSGYDYLEGKKVNYVSNDLYTSLYNKKVYKQLSSLFVVDGIKYAIVSPSDRTCDAIDCVYDESVANVHIGETVTYKNISLKVINANEYVCYDNPYIKNVELNFEGNVGGVSILWLF